MDIVKYINKLLLKHNCVIVPGLGGFVANYISAKIHPINHTFSPPSKEIVFNAGLKYNDALLASYIADELNINYSSALEFIEIQVNQLYKQLVKQKQIELPELGLLSIDNHGNISFKTENNYSFFAGSFGLDDFVSPPVIRPSITKHITNSIQKEKTKPQKIRKLNANLRWTAAAIIPLLAVITWASFNIDFVKSFNTGNSELLSFLFTKTKSKDIKTEKLDKAINTNDMVYIYDFSKYIPVEEDDDEINFPFSVVINNDELLTDEENINDTTENIAFNNIATNQKKYYIIGNCFKSLTNANTYVAQLIEKGYADASIAGVSPSGLHRVSFATFHKLEEAEKAMNNIRNTDQKDAWLLEE